MSEEVSFWFSLCRHSKQGGDESHLPKDISFVHSLLGDFVPLVALFGPMPPRCTCSFIKTAAWRPSSLQAEGGNVASSRC